MSYVDDRKLYRVTIRDVEHLMLLVPSDAERRYGANAVLVEGEPIVVAKIEPDVDAKARRPANKARASRNKTTKA